MSFEVRRGQTVGVIGRNGSGKSTLLQIICGTLYPTQGEVRVQGRMAAGVIAADLTGQPRPKPTYANTCYSLVAPGYAISVSGLYEAKDDQLVELPGLGTSPLDADAAYRAQEASNSMGWYESISTEIWDQ